MAKATIAGFDFKTLKEWQDGLKELDVEKIRSALDAGIAPATYVDGKHPLWFILGGSERPSLSGNHLTRIMLAEYHFSGTSKKYTDNPFQNKSDIIDLLLSHGLSLVDPVKGTDQSVMDSVLFGGENILVAKLIPAAIKQSVAAGQPPYQFNLDQIIEKAKPEDEDAGPLAVKACRDQLQKKLQNLEEIHGYVRMALDNPATDEDRDFVSTRAQELSFWQSDFNGPDQETLDRLFPIDPEALREAEKKSVRDPFDMFGLGGARRTNVEDKIITLKKENPEDIMKELDQYTGMEKFKANMRSLIFRVRFDQARQAKGLTTDVQNYHTAFLGNPGTGKTTSARLKARLLHSLGLTGPRYAELSRDSIVAKYVGHTEDKVNEIIDNSDIVFIDEFYSLVDGTSKVDFGVRAVDTIVSKLGNRKDSFTLFVAGYSDPTRRAIMSNEGLSSRIKIFEENRDFTKEELAVILDNNMAVQGYILEPEARAALLKGIEDEKKSQGNAHFGNARVVVSLVQDLPNQMANRLGQGNGGNFDQLDTAALSRITAEDVMMALDNRGIKDQIKPAIGFLTPVLGR